MSQKKILIVDDDPGILAMLKLMLRLEGYVPIVCEDAVQVFDLLATESPDLLLVDAFMPQLDGLSIIREIQKRDLPPKPPVILVTGNVDEAYIQQALDSGASGVLKKPFAKEELLERLQKLL